MSIVRDLIEKRNGNYCHVVEVNDACELEYFVEAVVEEFARGGYSADDIREFINTITVYALNDDNEREIYDFNINECLEECLEECLDNVDYLFETEEVI